MGEMNTCCLYVKTGCSKQILKPFVVKWKQHKKGPRMFQHYCQKLSNCFYIGEVGLL